jgi:hypothetical protein
MPHEFRCAGISGPASMVLKRLKSSVVLDKGVTSWMQLETSLT